MTEGIEASSVDGHVVMRISQVLAPILASAFLLAGEVHTAAAQGACTQMQALLSIAPQHREDVMAFIAPKLKERFGVELVAEAIGSAAMVERIAAQGKDPRISIAHWDVPVGISACDRGICAPINLAKLANVQNMPDWTYSLDANGQPVVLAAGVLGVGMLYNETALQKGKIAPPTSWADLERPEFAGRLAFAAPQATSGTAMLVMLAKIKGGGEERIDPGLDGMKKLQAKNTIFTWSSEMANLFQLGEIWVAVQTSNHAPALRAKGLPIKFVLPSEGSPAMNSGVSIVKGAPCQEAAYEYVNLYFSDEFQAKRMSGAGSLSPKKSAWEKLTPKELAEIGFGPSDLGKFINLDWRTINKARSDWIERWQRAAQ